MKLKKLESVLQDVVGFNAPKIELEQYPTSPHIASRILFTAHSAYDDIEDKAVIDLGCGTGMFAVGAAVLGSAYTLGLSLPIKSSRMFMLQQVWTLIQMRYR